MAVTALEKMGVDVDPLLARTQISKSKLANPIGRISIKKEHDFWSAAIGATSDPLLALHMAEHVPFGTFPLLEYIGASCESLYQALVFFGKYAEIVYGDWRPRLIEENNSVRFDLGTEGDPEEYRNTNEFGLAVMLSRLKHFSGGDVPLTKVCFRHSLVGSLDEFEKYFGAPVLFDQAEDSLIFDERIKKTSCTNSDNFLLSSLLKLTEKLFMMLPGKNRAIESDLIAKVKSAVKTQLSQGEPEIQKIAEEIAMSARTLQRKLESDGTSLSRIIVQVRKEQATEFLKDKSLTNEDIALMLGYSTLSAFNRAFKQWFNMTPSEFRKSQET